jgi:outer membrane protein insertion porin family
MFHRLRANAALPLAALAAWLAMGMLNEDAPAQVGHRSWGQPSGGTVGREPPLSQAGLAAPANRSVRFQDPGDPNPNPVPRAIAPPPAVYPPPASGFGTQPFGPPPVVGPAQPPLAPFAGGNIGGDVLNPPGPDGGQLMPPGTLMQPFAEEEGIVDLIGQVQETQTGRFSVGVGVNSDAGVLGNIVLEEQNFSLFNWPSRPGDLIYGNAFRGDGQHFRIEAVPGNELQRYTVTFNEPYLFDTPFSFGTNAFYYTRFYEDWKERRFGGNITSGYQVRPDLSLALTLRAEQVRLTDPRIPTPPEVADVVGNNDLYTGKITLLQDTRDNAFLPTEGYMVQMDYEQAFGQFTYPRGTIDARTYFLLHQRPDRSGRHVIALRGRAGITGSDTPVFENFFIGGTTTLRGFDFRGASPVVMGTTVGGEFMVLASAEYLLPVTADDALRMVFFVDTGTVEEDVRLDADTYRVAAGFGLRISVPGMGPAPIALDFAWPINKADTDDTRVFSFYVGFLR